MKKDRNCQFKVQQRVFYFLNVCSNIIFFFHSRTTGYKLCQTTQNILTKMPFTYVAKKGKSREIITVLKRSIIEYDKMHIGHALIADEKGKRKLKFQFFCKNLSKVPQKIYFFRNKHFLYTQKTLTNSPNILS